MAKILVVEDDQFIADGLQLTLEREGHHVLLATEGTSGLHFAKTGAPDLIILDIMVPHLNGFEIITELRRVGDKVPVIVLSARTGLADRVRGLDLGADDYMAKPFEIEELLARIRRRLNAKTQETSQFGRFSYDWSTQQLINGDSQWIVLSVRELKMLEFFLKRPQRIVSRSQIIESVWGDEYDGTDRTVDNFVMSLRRKIGGEFITTERGQGYRFCKKNDA